MRYIVCFPGGGFNDMLSVINRCIKHAIKYNRLLIIDTTKTEWFAKDIHDYISFSHKNIYNGSLNDIYATIKKLSIYPENMTITLTRSRIPWKFRTYNFDLNKDYTEDVLVYYMSGGGIPYETLKHMYVKPNVLNVYYERLNKLSINYNSFHIRNTDKKSDNLELFIKNNEQYLNESGFLASDDANIINMIKEKYKKIITFSSIPELASSQKNIHYNHIGIEQELFIVDCIVDILLLASGERFFFSCPESGYSKLANYLFENKQILNKILINKISDIIQINQDVKKHNIVIENIENHNIDKHNIENNKITKIQIDMSRSTMKYKSPKVCSKKKYKPNHSVDLSQLEKKLI